MKLFFCIAILFLAQYAKAQEPSPEYLYLDSNDNDTVALAQITYILNNKNTKAQFIPELQTKQLARYINVEKFDSTVILANKYILENKDKKNEFFARLYSLKSTAFYYLFNMEQAKESLIKGMEIAKENKNFITEARMSSNLGGILVEQKNYNEAEVLLKKAIYIHESVLKKESVYYFQAMRILATNYDFKKQYALADSFFKKSINGLEKLHINNGTYQGALNFYALFLSKQGRFKEAKALFNKALSIRRESVFTKDITALYFLIGHFYMDQKDYETACLYLDSCYHSQEKDFQEKNVNELANAEKKFKTELLKRDVQIANEKRLNWIYAFGFLAALAIGAFLAFYFNNKKKEVRAKLEQQQMTINAFVEGEEKEKTRLSRELHDGIGQELLALCLQLRKAGNNNTIITTAENIGKDIRNLSHQLMPMTLKMLGLLDAMEEICDKLLEPSNIGYHIDAKGLEERLPEKLEISLYRIFQELIHNVVKHSAATMVQIQIIKTPTHINLIVEDDGIGFRQLEKPKGIGLSNLASRVQMMNGQLRYESEDGEGTTTIVRVPV